MNSNGLELEGKSAVETSLTLSMRVTIGDSNGWSFN